MAAIELAKRHITSPQSQVVGDPSSAALDREDAVPETVSHVYGRSSHGVVCYQKTGRQCGNAPKEATAGQPNRQSIGRSV